MSDFENRPARKPDADMPPESGEHPFRRAMADLYATTAILKTIQPENDRERAAQALENALVLVDKPLPDPPR